MATTYIYPPAALPGKSQAFGGVPGNALTADYNSSLCFSYNVATGQLSSAPSSRSIYGIMDISADSPQAGFWGAGPVNFGFFQNLNGSITPYTASPSTTNFFFTGVAYAVSGTYFSGSSGLLQVSGVSLVQVSGATGTYSLGLTYANASELLYAVDLAVSPSKISVYNTGTSAESTASVPVTNLLTVNGASAASGIAAVFGSALNPITASYQSVNVAVAPDGFFGVFVNPSSNTLNLLSGTDPAYNVVNTYTASGTANWCAWNDLSTQVLTTNSDATISIYAVASSALSIFQVLTIPHSGAIRIAGFPNSTQAAYCNPSNNYVGFLNFSGSWSISQNLTLTNPTCIWPLSSTSALVGVASGVSEITYQSNTWGVTTTHTLTYTPSDVTDDGLGSIISTGYAGSTGYLTVISPTGTISTTSFTGTPESVFVQQGQILVQTSSGLSAFTYLNGYTPVLVNSYSAFSGAITNISSNGQSIFISDTYLYQYKWQAPFEIAPIPYGWLSTYNGTTNTWGPVIYLTTPFSTPADVIWTSGGAMYAATNNVIYEYTISGSLLNSYTLTNYSGNATSQPTGASKMAILSDGHLYAVSSLNSALLKVV